jgi:hypothetical protein
MPRDPFIREKFTRECSAARKLVAEYYRRFPKDCYQTEVESWRDLQAANSSLRWSGCGSRPVFDEPMAQLVTLRDAGTYIAKLPRTDHDAPEWQASMEALILVAEKDGLLQFRS